MHKCIKVNKMQKSCLIGSNDRKRIVDKVARHTVASSDGWLLYLGATIYRVGSLNIIKINCNANKQQIGSGTL